MLNESIKTLSESGFNHPIYGRTTYMSSEKQKNFLRYHIGQTKDKSLTYNKVEFGKDNTNSTVDMVVPIDGVNKRIYITFYSFENAKTMFPRNLNQIKYGAFTFYIEDFNGILK